jgi:hypothetical protein
MIAVYISAIKVLNKKIITEITGKYMLLWFMKNGMIL